MDNQIKTLLIELAKTTLRVLDAQTTMDLTVQPTPWATAVNKQADHGTPTVTSTTTKFNGNIVARDPHSLVKGDAVRFWDGAKWAVGTVVSLCRRKPNQSAARVNVRVEKANGRGKTHQIDVDKCSLVKGVQP